MTIDKKAKELADDICSRVINGYIAQQGAYSQQGYVASIIATAFRADRQEVAERVRETKFVHKMAAETGAEEWVTIPKWATAAHVVAILKED